MGNVCSLSISIDDLVPRCFGSIATQVKYATHFEEIKKKTETALKELTEKKNDVNRRIEAEGGPRKKPLDQVKGWISLVEDMEKEVAELIISSGNQEVAELNKSSSNQDLSYLLKYKWGKKLTKKLKDVDDLKSKGVFQEVVGDLPPSVVDVVPMEKMVGTESMFDQAWGYLQEEEVGIMGLFGLGGVGKTTLLTQIHNKFADTLLGFEVVIWVVVSKNQNIERIQHDIGKKIGFHGEAWEKRSLDEKARDIYSVLSRKKIVVLLDDMWERLDLSKLGIPPPDRQNRCKVVLTTRSEQVCSNMDPHRKIRVNCLPWRKAWDLFREMVGEETLNSHPEILSLSKTVAQECGGLPLALITVGRAMNCKKTPQEWKYAIHVLKNVAVQFPNLEDEVFGRLHFSYQRLPSDIVKQCFLYCSLYPEDYEIDKEYLIDKWIGEGLLGDTDEDEAQNQGYHFIGMLLHACLLENGSEYFVKMHDVIRDMALWIVSDYGESKNKFFVQAGVELTKAPEASKWQRVNRMSLMCNNISTLEEMPACPELSSLLLSENHQLDMIATCFFQSMHNLKVLDLSWCNLSSSSFDIGKLTLLQDLNLSRTEIRQLPVGLENCTRMKRLNLGWTGSLVSPPPQVISRLKSLQVLNMYYSATEVEPTGASEALIEKLGELKFLNHWGVTIGNVCSFRKLSTFVELQRCLRSLLLIDMKSVTNFYISSLSHMKRLEELTFSDCWDIEDIEIDNSLLEPEITIRPSFHHLRAVTISSCPKIKSLAGLIFIPHLTNIMIASCEDLEEVISRGTIDDGKVFEKLEILSAEDLPKLKSIYPRALLFPCLKRLNVFKCPELKKLPLNSETAKRNPKIVIDGEGSWFNALEWEDETTHDTYRQRSSEAPFLMSF